MISWRSLSGHLIALGVASVVAFSVWTRKDPAASEHKGNVEVWGGSADRVELVSFESENRSVRLERRKDSIGPWFVGTVEKTTELRVPVFDAGPGDAGDAGPPPEKKHETTRFISVEQGKKLADSLAPLYALRRLGKIEDARAEEFGLNKPEGTLHVSVDGHEHTLVLGGPTPGGADRYAKDDAGDVWAISGNVAQSMLFAESRLIERNLHGFEPDELRSVKIERGEKSRELVRIEDKKDGWADSTTPNVLDETAGNWMSKLERLRIMSYVEKPAEPLTPESAVVRVQLFAKGNRSLGFLELYKLPPGENGKPSYLVRTEQTRWYAEVLGSVAEQVEQDLGSVVKAM